MILQAEERDSDDSISRRSIGKSPSSDYGSYNTPGRRGIQVSFVSAARKLWVLILFVVS